MCAGQTATLRLRPLPCPRLAGLPVRHAAAACAPGPGCRAGRSTRTWRRRPEDLFVIGPSFCAALQTGSMTTIPLGDKLLEFRIIGGSFRRRVDQQAGRGAVRRRPICSMISSKNVRIASMAAASPAARRAGAKRILPAVAWYRMPLADVLPSDGPAWIRGRCCNLSMQRLVAASADGEFGTGSLARVHARTRCHDRYLLSLAPPPPWIAVNSRCEDADSHSVATGPAERATCGLRSSNSRGAKRKAMTIINLKSST